MVEKKIIEKQLKKLGFNHKGWGRSEIGELHNIILPDEEIYELANGIYEGGFALLVSTSVRVLLIDKKPLNYLTVEDLRFDMINEMDYNHRLLGANISIATGNKTLKFTSFNQARLRKLIGHVQHCMAEAKRQQNLHQEDQKTHLQQINEQLQAYLAAQHRYTQELHAFQQAQQAGHTAEPPPEPARPSPELSDFLFAQSLLTQYQQEASRQQPVPSLPYVPTEAAKAVDHKPAGPAPLPQPAPAPMEQLPASRLASPSPPPGQAQTDELYAEGVREVFGKHLPSIPTIPNPLELNPMKIAYSKLPMALRNRKFGRPSFHDHSAADQARSQQRAAELQSPSI